MRRNVLILSFSLPPSFSKGEREREREKVTGVASSSSLLPRLGASISSVFLWYSGIRHHGIGRYKKCLLFLFLQAFF